VPACVPLKQKGCLFVESFDEHQTASALSSAGRFLAVSASIRYSGAGASLPPEASERISESRWHLRGC
jgi:hypothetical protein